MLKTNHTETTIKESSHPSLILERFWLISKLVSDAAPRLVLFLAAINNLIVGLVLHLGWTILPAARRYFDAHPTEAQRLLLRRLTDF